MQHKDRLHPDPAPAAGPAARPDDVENIVGAALFALGRGARGARINLSAVESFRRRFAEKIAPALQEPDWQANWQQEEAYLLAHVGAVGGRAARLAFEEGRACITRQDLELALTKVRGHVPIAGRWCPS
jgi:hypothetical protein